MVGCTDHLDYNDDDVAAIVRGEEITIGELRFLFPDEDIADMINGAIQTKLMFQEVKKMNIDVSEEMKNQMEAAENDELDEIGISTNSSFREFIDSQAKKLGMSPDEYYKKYHKKTTEIGVYMEAYIKEMLGEPMGDREYTKQANQVLKDLLEKNKDNIEILLEEK